MTIRSACCLLLITGLLMFNDVCIGQSVYTFASQEYVTGKYQQAIDHFTRSIQNGEEVAKAYLYRGLSKARLYQFDAGMNDLVIWRSLDSAGKKTHFQLAKFFAIKDEYDRAILCLDSAIVDDPMNAFAYYERSRAYLACLNYGAAIADASAAIAIDSVRPEFYDLRARALLQSGGAYPEARKDLDRAVGLAEKRKWYFVRGHGFWALQDYGRAIADFNSALAINETNGEALYYRGICYLALGNFSDACADLGKSWIYGYKTPGGQSN